MADALEAAHLAGVVHRDLKASNIMLVPAMDGGTRAVVMDFGLARRVNPEEREGRLTETGKILGTWDYMAPELLDGGHPSPASDIYALGILAYVMVTGDRPFPGDSPISAVIRRSRERVPPPSWLVPGLPAALGRGDSRLPGGRPGAAVSTAIVILIGADQLERVKLTSISVITSTGSPLSNVGL